MQDTIQENNQAMIQGFFQMLQGAGFTPRLQSSYSQGKYPLALGFKTPPDVTPLPKPAIEFTPLTTLPGVQTLVFGRTEQNPLEEGRGKVAQDHQEEISPVEHRVEGLEILLLRPNKMTSRNPLRPHRVAPLPNQNSFARTNQKLHL